MMIKLTTYISLKSKISIEPSLLLKLEMEDYYSFTIFNQTTSFKFEQFKLSKYLNFQMIPKIIVLFKDINNEN